MLRLLSILFRKANTLIMRGFWYPFKYRPKGVYKNYQAFLEDCQGAVYREIYPAYISDRTENRDWYENSLKTDDTIINPVRIEIGAAFALKIPNGRAYTDFGANSAFIYQDRLIPEVGFQFEEGTYTSAEKNGIFKKKYLEGVKRYKGTVFSLVSAGGANSNYFHFLFDSLCRVDLLQKAGWLEEVDWFWIPTDQFAFQRESLLAAGIPPEKCINSYEIRHIQADYLICTHLSRPRGHISRWQCEYLQSLRMPPTRPYSPYVFISRDDAPTRRMLNESDWEQHLKPFGFEKYVLSELNFQEQANLFAQARCVIAQHGAGLSNIVFSPPQCWVIELYHENYINPDFFGIAKQNQLQYARLACQKINENHDIQLNWEELIKKLVIFEII